MKQMRLVFASLAILAAAVWAVTAVAGGGKSAAGNGACGSMSAEECRARMAAGQTCPMHGADAATASTHDACSAHGATAATADDGCSAHATRATAAGRCPYSGATTADDGCSMHGAAAVTASAKGAGGCTVHGAAVTASMRGSCAGHGASTAAAGGCSMHGVTASAGGCTAHGARGAMAHAGCSEHGLSAMAAGLGSNCTGADRASASAGQDCESCQDLAACDAELQAAGASMQTVPIKNGVMFVYTARAPGGVNAIHSVMARRTEHLSRIIGEGARAQLCEECKSMRGEMASGRLVREVVNIESGSLVLVTSDDPTLIKRIRAVADNGKLAVKS